MRIPISQEAVDLALNRALNHYDKAPDFLDDAYIIDVQETGSLAAFLRPASTRNTRKG